MPQLSSSARGIALMILAAAVFVANDAMMKMATTAMPPLQVLFVRGIAASIWCVPLILLSRNGFNLHLLLDKWVLVRNGLETVTVFCFIMALARMPIADITAISQLAPMVLMIGAALLYGEPLGWRRIGLIALGFVGAVLVAQPTGDAFSPYAFLGLGVAVGVAARDLAARRVPSAVPSPIVACSAALLVMAASGVGTLAFESWETPSLSAVALLAAAGLLLTSGHLFIFLAYRAAPVGVVAPFLYMFTVWAVVAGIVVFGDIPNPAAMGGIVLILVSGVALVMLDSRHRRMEVVA